MTPTLLVLTKVPGRMPVKTRLWAWLGEAHATRLYRAMLAETLQTLRTIGTPTLAYSPPDCAPHDAFPEHLDCRFLPVGGDDAPACLDDALVRVPDAPLLLLGGDAPDLPRARIVAALDAVDDRADAAIVPSLDGGFVALAMRRPEPGLGAAFRFGGRRAAAEVVAALERRGRRVAVLAAWSDVDTPADVVAWRRRCVEARATARGALSVPDVLDAAEVPEGLPL